MGRTFAHVFVCMCMCVFVAGDGICVGAKRKKMEKNAAFASFFD